MGCCNVAPHILGDHETCYKVVLTLLHTCCNKILTKLTTQACNNIIIPDFTSLFGASF